MKTLLQTFGLLTLVVGFYQPVTAAVLVTGEANNNSTGYTVSNSDLLQTSVSSIATVGAAQGGDGGADNAIGWAPLNDGSFGGFGANDGALVRSSPNNGQSITFNLNGAYDITQIDTYGEWGNDGRDNQNYAVYFSTDGGANFSLFTTVAYVPTVGGSNISTHVNLIDDAFGPLATGVTNIQFVFNSQENGFVGYREFDVTGTAVPEPSTYALLAVGFGVLIWLRRKQAV